LIILLLQVVVLVEDATEAVEAVVDILVEQLHLEQLEVNLLLQLVQEQQRQLVVRRGEMEQILVYLE
jgi:hypothetical protein